MSSFPKQPLPVFPLYRPILRHTGNVTGADRKTGKTTPSPRTATPSDGFLRPSPVKRRNTQAIVLSSLYNPSSAHLSFFSLSPKSTNERGRSVFKPPARPTANPVSSGTCNRDNRLSVLRVSPPRRGKEIAGSSGGGGVWVSAASAQAKRDHIAPQRQCSSASLAVVCSSSSEGWRDEKSD